MAALKKLPYWSKRIRDANLPLELLEGESTQQFNARNKVRKERIKQINEGMENIAASNADEKILELEEGDPNYFKQGEATWKRNTLS